MATIANFERAHLSSASPVDAALPARHFGARLAGWLTPAGILAQIREYFRRQRVMHELRCLNDRELSDIRMTRAEISEIFKPEFAKRREADEAGLKG